MCVRHGRVHGSLSRGAVGSPELCHADALGGRHRGGDHNSDRLGIVCATEQLVIIGAGLMNLCLIVFITSGSPAPWEHTPRLLERGKEWPVAPTTPPAANTQWESIKSASERTGFSEWTLRQEINTGRLPAYRLSTKPGSRIRLKVADVDALLHPVLPAAITGGAQ